MKGDTDATDFRLVRRSYDYRDTACPFCRLTKGQILLENPLACLIRDPDARRRSQLLVIPKRHVTNYFELGTAESRACDILMRRARLIARKSGKNMDSFDVEINTRSAGRGNGTHCKVLLIPQVG
jgi:diadenosine tetraphosphate (Ap4A) HIT family hydrolase